MVKCVADLPSFAGNDHHLVKVQFSVRKIMYRGWPRSPSFLNSIRVLGSHPSRWAATPSALSDVVTIELGVMYTASVCPHRYDQR